jgi:hypothetical protein
MDTVVYDAAVLWPPIETSGGHGLEVRLELGVVPSVVVTIALRRKALILTSDPADIERLVRASGREVAVIAAV